MPRCSAWRLQDMAELEAAVGQSLAPVEALGGPHRVLRAFRPLLFLDTCALASSPLLAALPPGVALSHLFSRAPPGLQSPHQRSGFTPAQVAPVLWSQAPSRCTLMLAGLLPGLSIQRLLWELFALQALDMRLDSGPQCVGHSSRMLRCSQRSVLMHAHVNLGA